MTTLAIVLLLISATLHATWNLLGKRQNPSTAFMVLANTLGTLALTPVLLAFPHTLARFTPAVWGLIALTGLSQAVYYAGLAGAYRAGDLSLTYPLIRAVPVLIVTGLAMLLAQGEAPSRLSIAGMGLIVLGCVLLPLTSLRQFHWRAYATPAAGLALLAALGTVGYSLLDDRALRILRGSDGLTSDTLVLTVVYAVVAGWSASLWGAAVALVRREDRATLRRLGRADVRQSALVGVFIFVGYLLVLIALALVPSVGYAVAFRQLSIPLGTILGVLYLKEPAYAPRLLGVALVFVGLVFVAIG